MTTIPAARGADVVDGGRGGRTRSAILDASRRLFLERGYGGTRVNAITEACGISNAGFYTYFKDKREVFSALGETAYHEVLAVLDRWRHFSSDVGIEEVRTWVNEYFAYMDRHGAFVMAAAHSAPDDEAFGRSRNHMMTRAAWKLGQAIVGDGGHSPEAVGVTVMSMLDRSWFAVNRQTVPVDREDVIAVAAEMIFAISRQ
jgi:AcrR family transcriptional regulator